MPLTNTSPLTTVEKIDPARYAGVWYEIARLPNPFESVEMRGITAEYSLLPDGKISVRNTAILGNGKETHVAGVARVVEASNSKLKVTFAPQFLRLLPFVWANYWILDLDAEHYSWALIGEPSRQCLWMLSRTPIISVEDYSRLFKSAHDKGYDLERLIRVIHSLRE